MKTSRLALLLLLTLLPSCEGVELLLGGSRQFGHGLYNADGPGRIHSEHIDTVGAYIKIPLGNPPPWSFEDRFYRAMDRGFRDLPETPVEPEDNGRSEIEKGADKFDAYDTVTKVVLGMIAIVILIYYRKTILALLPFKRNGSQA